MIIEIIFLLFVALLAVLTEFYLINKGNNHILNLTGIKTLDHYLSIIKSLSVLNQSKNSDLQSDLTQLADTLLNESEIKRIALRVRINGNNHLFRYESSRLESNSAQLDTEKGFDNLEKYFVEKYQEANSVTRPFPNQVRGKSFLVFNNLEKIIEENHLLDTNITSHGYKSAFLGEMSFRDQKLGYTIFYWVKEVETDINQLFLACIENIITQLVIKHQINQSLNHETQLQVISQPW